jgi:hypothetical protein
MEDEADCAQQRLGPVDKPPDRDNLRAQALRANLMRRKAQARERSESAPVSPPKSPEDA